MKYNYILYIWIASILASIQNLGQFCIGAIASLAITHFKEETNNKSTSCFSNEAILACCLGISSAIFYTWIRFDPAQNIYIMFTKRYLLIPVNLISLSMLLSNQGSRVQSQKERIAVKNILIIASINIILTLPFAKTILPNQLIIIYFLVVTISAVVTTLLMRDSERENKKTWGIIFSTSILLLIFFCESRIIGGIYISSLTLLFCYKMQNRTSILKNTKRVLTAVQSIGVFCFSIMLPLLVISSPWITPHESNWSSKVLWIITGSRHFSTWSYNLWGSKELGFRTIFGLEGEIPFIDTYKYYNKNLTEFYGEPKSSIEQVSKYLGHAHSDPIQKLLNLATGSSTEIIIAILSLITIVFLWKKMIDAFSKYKTNLEKDFEIFCLISNLAILAYITSESFTLFQPILILSGQALCLQQFYKTKENTNAKSRVGSSRSISVDTLLNPRHPLMLIYPYLILLVVPGMTLILKSS